MNTPVYLDHNATTPMDPRVLEAMMPFLTDRYGNAASRHHSFGCDAARAVEEARTKVADLIGADPREIIWTSGATEADNLAIQGVAAVASAPGGGRRRPSRLQGDDAASKIHSGKGHHIVTVRTEHKAVLDVCRWLEEHGFEVTYLPVDSNGCLDLDQLTAAITDRTILVSVMHANNEIGVLHPIERIGRLCKERGVLFHTDATQSFGKEPIDVEAFGIDLLSLSAHKMYGPKGIGALYVRRRNPRVRCEPLLHGGGHERGLRSGTLNVPGIVGLAAAAEICQQERETEQRRIGGLRDRLQLELFSRIPGAQLNGHPQQRLANTLNVSFAGVDGDSLMKAMPNIAVSSSSACTSAMQQPSYVVGALGASDEVIQGSIRFSLGRFTTEEEIDFAVEQTVESVESCRAEDSGATGTPRPTGKSVPHDNSRVSP